MDDTLASRLDGFYEKIFISNCMDWFLKVQASIDLSLNSMDNVEIIDITSKHASYHVLYDGIRLFTMKLEIKGNHITIVNKFEMLFSFEDKICSKCRSLDAQCKCKKWLPLTDNMKWKTDLGNKIKARANSVLMSFDEQVKLPMAEITTPEKQTLPNEEVEAIIDGLVKQLGEPKTRLKNLVAQVLKENPSASFDDLLRGVMQNIRPK
jgi:hypothetical protein